ncbi:MAG: pyridoxal-phosphate dependent enzyme, partial [Melioribacteraceae bacterium]|nr:pyridoxal-phosphate dependent enzyme [Melioribacteraceae bacterium]
MEYYSTRNRNNVVSFRTAILQGIAADKGLFMPASIPKLDSNILDNLSTLTLKEIALLIAKNFVQNEIADSELEQIIDESITFETPLVDITDQISVLELFHGPTLAFKDFGARFMARTMQYFMRNDSNELTILVATSGDTGSAVANGFLGVEGINVIVLYPKNKISEIQEKQITTLGENIHPVEIEGNFDDCQRLVKTAFVDPDLQGAIRLSSANSINIGRLIPQSFYYFEGVKQKRILLPLGRFIQEKKEYF